jgi:hypothetical protein
VRSCKLGYDDDVDSPISLTANPARVAQLHMWLIGQSR